MKNLNLLNQVIRRGSGVNLNLFRYAAMVLVLLLGVSEMWATSNYYAKLKITKAGTTSAGKVYIANSNTKPNSETNNTFVNSSATTTSGGNVTMYYWVDITSPGYYAVMGSELSGEYISNSGAKSVSLKASTTADGYAEHTATVTFNEITIGAGVASPASINATDNSTTCTDYTGTMTFATKGDAKNDFKDATPPIVNTGHGAFEITGWEVNASTGAVTVNYKFHGDGTYGGSVAKASRSRSTSATLTLTSAVGTNKNTCSVSASFPNIIVSAGSAEAMTTINTTPKTAEATFPVQWADDKDDFTAAFSEISGGGAWIVNSITYTATDAQSGTITVNYTFNPQAEIGNHSAKLTLSANGNAGGASNYVVINAESEALASDDASVTYNSTTTTYGTLAAAIAAANSQPGAVVKLLRNIPVDDAHKINSPISVTGMMTLDLNSYTIEKTGLVNGNARVLDINMSNANSVLTIMDSRTGGKIRGEGNNNSNLLTSVYVTKGVLNFESGEIECVNTNTGADAKATGIRTLADAKLLMTGGTVTATSSGSQARGVFPKTAPGTENYVVISGGTINVKGATQATGIDCESSSTTVDDPTKASVVLSGVTVNVETTSSTEAIAIRTAEGVSLGIQSGTYNATAKTTTVYALQSSGYTAVLGGTFNATATTTTAHALRCEKGITAVRGGMFTATAEQKTAHGAYICDGAKLLTYGGTFKGVVNAMVDGGWVTGTQVYDGGTLEAQGGTFIGEANNLNQSSEIAVCAAGIYLNNSSKASYATISNATLQGKINNANLNGAASDTHRGAHGLMTRTTSSVTLTNCAISANSAHKYAFGVRSTNTPIDIKNSSISVTSSKSYNYGIYTYGTAAVTMSNSTVECTSQEAECSGAFLNNGTRLDAEKTNFNVTVNQSSVTAVTAANSRGVNLEIGSVANLNGCVIKFKGNANYTSTVYGIRNIGTASIEDCTIKVYSVKEAAYALCGGESSVSTGVGSGKFYVSTGTTDGSTVTTGTNTFSMYGNNSVGKTYLYGGYYTQINNLEKFLPAGYGVETLPSGSTEYGEGYRYAIRATEDVGDPVCKIGTTPYTTLEEALEFVNKNSGTEYTILMVADYTLPAGNYTLPSKATLLVPYKSDQTSIDTHPSRYYGYTTPSPFRKLTFATGAHLDALGKIQAGGRQAATGQMDGKNGCPHEKYGWIYLQEGSTITLESGSHLYAWGYVTGSGEIDAKRGSFVYESFQIKDWRGGTATSGWKGKNKGTNGAFPVTQYYVQNIECPVKFRPGATEKCDGTVNAGSSAQSFNDVQFIGITNSGSFFEMDDEDMSEDTWVRKWYDAVNDKQVYEVNSSVKMNSISLSLYGYSFSSSDFVLPVTNNLKIHLLTGSLQITQNTELLPGAEIEVDKEATVYINSSKSLYVFDIDDWMNLNGTANVHTYPLPYSPSWGTACPRGKKVTTDAALNIHGKFQVNGSLYTTAGGAKIYSSNEDAGTITYGTAAPSASATVYVNVTTTASSKTAKTANPAWLKNEDTSDPWSYTEGTAANKSWIFYDNKWNCWEEKNCFGYDNEDKPYAKPAAWVKLTSDVADLTDHLFRDAETGNRRFLLDNCTWWEVEPTPDDGNKYKCIDPDHNGKYKYYEDVNNKWQEALVTITWKNGDATLATYSKTLYGTRPTYLDANPTKAKSTSEYYTWLGWTMGSADGEFFAKDAELPVATENTTYYAYFETHKYEYTISFKNYDEAVLEAKRWAHGEIPTYEGTPLKPATAAKEYTHDGWSTTKNGSVVTIPAATAAATYYAHFAESDRKYTIQWVNYNGTVLKEEQVAYNTNPTAPVTPTRPNDTYYTYTFDAWSPAVGTVTGNQTYTATYNYVKMVTKYEVLFKNGTTTIFSQNLVENSVPVFDGNEPTKDATAQYSYTFDGWSTTNGGALAYAKDAALPPLTEDVTYYAHFAQITNTYKVQWKSEDGKQLLETDAAVTYNTTPEFNSTTPTKANVGTTLYLFDGWSATVGGAKLSTLPAVTEDKVFYAHFSVAVASVTAGGNTTYHTTIADAFTAAKGKTNPTIKMLQDVALGASSVTYDGTNTCILDLNGHTISGTSNLLLIVDNASANFTITDNTESKLGKLSMNTSSTAGAAFCAQLKNGKLYLEAGTIYLYTTSSSKNAVGVRVDAGEFIMNGGTVHTVATQNNIVAHGVQPLGTANAIINGGTVRAESANGVGSGMYVTGTITVNGGKFYVTGKTAYMVHASTITPSKVKIQGGYYNINTNMATCVVSSYSLRATTAAEKAEVGNDYNYRVVATYTVTFNANGHGTAPASQVIEAGQKATEPTAPTATGYTFGGWCKEAGCTNEWNFATDVVTAATPLYAKWTVNTHKLAWNFNGGTPSGSYTEANNALAYGSAITYPALSKTGYSFAGWSSEATSMPDEDLTITAQWTPNTNTAYTVEHYWQNINNDEYTKHETVGMTGTTDAATAAEAKNYTGFEAAQPFEQGTIAPDGSTVVKIYYNRKTYAIIWDVKLNGNTEAHKEETLRYGATPSYGSTPTKEQNESQVFAFSGWNPTPYAVNKDETYTGSFNVSPRPYTITFVNDNGVELWHYDFGWGSTPSYGGSDPVSSHTGDGYTYTFADWKPALAPVGGTATYMAKYNRSAEAITVSTQETVTDNTSATTTTVVDGGTLTVGTGNEDLTLQSTTIIVESGGQLDIKDGASVEADVFIIQATTEEQGEEDAKEEVQISGEMSETGTKNIGAIYYDLTRKHGTENFLARVWYAVAVPWAVETPNYSDGGVFIKRGGEFIPQRLGATFDLLSYDGECRATNGASANCWVYLEDEIVGGADAVMVPGKLYMIYLTEETSTIRFKKKDGVDIHTNTLTVSPYAETTSNEGKDANWNGIANPATYKAYMNVSVGGLVQKFVPGTQPRDGGSYLPIDLKDKQSVGQPLFVQVNPNAASTTVQVTRTKDNPSASAPRRMAANGEQEARYAISIAANGKLADRLYIQTAEEKEDKYVIGKDMSKMGVSSCVAQMWVARYDSKLCLNTMALTRDKANYPLGISVPKAGEYMIFAPTDIASGDNIYLTCDNRVIWNLTMSPYYASLEQGTTTRYGLRLVRNTPTVQTGVAETQTGNAQCMKVIMDDHVYILRGEELYTITGQKAK